MNKELSANTNLSHYRIIRKLGAGGMGEVYLAEDRQLERKVALKVLPADVAQNAERMRRFVQEAKAASRLNHPNIAHIYEIGEVDGTNFIAMEFVEGATLREKIHGEKIDLPTQLKYLAQVADGLAKAHAAGIVHRDLKPDNIMISRDGYAKILDFGLAKLIGPQKTSAAHAGEEANEATTAMMPPQPLSTPGMIMGTVGYISPEQAQGRREIDHRSDIFSFGCVLFEAATGRQPFVGDSVIDTLYKIIKAPAPPVRDFNPHAPLELQRIVRRCLQKDPDERFQSIKDVAVELKELRREMRAADNQFDYSVEPQTPQRASVSGDENATAILSARGGATANQAAVRTDEASRAHSTSSAEYIVGKVAGNKFAFAFGAIVLLALVGFGVYRYLGVSDANKEARFEKVKITRLTKSGKAILAAISPDGKYFAHVMSDAGQQTLFVRQTTANNDIAVIPAARVEYWGITFSKDSNDLFYAVRQGGSPNVLYRMPALGGTAQKLIERVDSPVTFSPDGKHLAFVRADFPNKGESALVMANSDGTGEKTIAIRKMPERFAPLYFTGPSWSPDGKSIAVTTAGYGGSLKFKVIKVSLADGKESDLTKQGWGYIGRVEWLADGNGLMMTAREQNSLFRQIWYLPTDGEARQITNDFSDYRSLSVSGDSTKLVTVQVEELAAAWLAPSSDMNQARQILPANPEGPLGMTWTPDGKIIYQSSSSRDANLWIMNSDGSGQKQLTANNGINVDAAVSRDGSRIAFRSMRPATSGIWIMGIDGSGPKQLTEQSGDAHPTFTADGKWIVYTSFNPETSGLWKVPVEDGTSARLTEGNYALPAVSPDGKLIAALYLENQTVPDQLPDKIAIISIDGGTPLKTFGIQNIAAGQAMVVWSPDGKSLIYNQVKENIANLWSQPLGGGQPKQISDFKDSLINSFALSADGKQIAVSRSNYTRDAIVLSNEN